MYAFGVANYDFEGKIQNDRDVCNFHVGKINGYSEELERLLHGDPVKKKLIESMEKSMKFHEQQEQQFEAVIAEHWKELGGRSWAYNKFVLEELDGIIDAEIAVTAKLRLDLGLSTQLEAAAEQRRNYNRRASEQMSSLKNL